MESQSNDQSPDSDDALTKDAVKERFRAKFNLKVFNICNNGLTVEGKEPLRTERSFQLTQSQWAEYVDRIVCNR